jgi:hypothetical protein
MSTARGTPELASPSPTVEERALLASDRLERNRERLSGWLEQDRQQQAACSHGGWLPGALRPVLKSLDVQPLAMLAVGALAQAYTHRTRAPSAQPLGLQLMGTAMTVVRRHPKLSLTVAAVAGAAWWWSHSRRDPRS